jgi:hypothetical protein
VTTTLSGYAMEPTCSLVQYGQLRDCHLWSIALTALSKKGQTLSSRCCISSFDLHVHIDNTVAREHWKCLLVHESCIYIFFYLYTNI